MTVVLDTLVAVRRTAMDLLARREHGRVELTRKLRQRGASAEMIDLGVLHGFVEKSGAWYAYNGSKIGQGKANSAKFLADNPDIAATLEKQIRDKLLTPAPDVKAAANRAPVDEMEEVDTDV